MYAIVYPDVNDSGAAWRRAGPRAGGPGSGPPGPGPGAWVWVNYSIHGPPTPPTQKFNFWPRRAPGPTQNSGAHRGEPIPPIPVEIRCNRTGFWPKTGLAHVCSSLPSPFGRSGPGTGPPPQPISQLSPKPSTFPPTFPTTHAVALPKPPNPHQPTP